MSEDTYAKRQRREWYAESEYEPDVPPETPVVTGSSIHLALLDSARGWGKSVKAADFAMQNMTLQFSIDDKATEAFQDLANTIAGSYTLFAKKFTAATQKSDYVQFPPPLDETPRERALRLKKQPHPMAASSRGWDHRGRRRY